MQQNIMIFFDETCTLYSDEGIVCLKFETWKVYKYMELLEIRNTETQHQTKMTMMSVKRYKTY